MTTLPVAGFAAGDQSDISLQTPTGTIYGTLTRPSKLPAPVVLIIAGSGPTDRNGNSSVQLHTQAYAMLAADLAQRGIASVRYDKRGIAASASAVLSEEKLRFTDYVSDAEGWLALLRADNRFIKIIVAGHSEGSLIGMIAAQDGRADTFVSLEGAGRPAYVVLREQLKPKLTPDLYAQSDAILTQLQAGHIVGNIPASLAILFRPSVQPYLISWFAYNPAVEIAKLTIPVTIVQGTADVQTTLADGEALHAAAPRATYVVIGGMNHVLKHAPDTSSMEAVVKGYDDLALPLDPRAIDAVVTATR